MDDFGQDSAAAHNVPKTQAVAETTQTEQILQQGDKTIMMNSLPLQSGDLEAALEKAVAGDDGVPEQMTEAMPDDMQEAALMREDQGCFECEVWAEGSEGSAEWINCTKNPEHKNFIPAPEFSLHHLPEPYRQNRYLQGIRSISHLAVRLRVIYVSMNRPPDFPFYRYRGRSLTHTGSGLVHKLMFDNSESNVDASDTFTNKSSPDVLEEALGASAREGGDENEEEDQANFHVIRDMIKQCCEKHRSDTSAADGAAAAVVNDSEMDTVIDALAGAVYIAKLGEVDDDDDVNDDEEIDYDELLEYDASIKRFLLRDDDLDTEEDISNDEDNSEDEDDVSDDEKDDDSDDNFEKMDTGKGSSDTFGRIHPCPCPECSKSNTPEKTGYYVNIVTARHVVYDSTEAKKTIADLFYDDKKEEGIKHLYGMEMHMFHHAGDWAMLLCVTHDFPLVCQLQKLMSRMTERVEHMKNSSLTPLAVLCSHPHGQPKQITVGQWIRRILHDVREDKSTPDSKWTSYFYNTPTCRGSSGAAVLILGQRVGTRIFDSMFHPHHGSYSPGENQSGIFVSKTNYQLIDYIKKEFKKCAKSQNQTSKNEMAGIALSFMKHVVLLMDELKPRKKKGKAKQEKEKFDV